MSTYVLFRLRGKQSIPSSYKIFLVPQIHTNRLWSPSSFLLNMAPRTTGQEEDATESRSWRRGDPCNNSPDHEVLTHDVQPGLVSEATFSSKDAFGDSSTPPTGCPTVWTENSNCPSFRPFIRTSNSHLSGYYPMPVHFSVPATLE